MQWRNTVTRYGFIASLLHWIIVAGVIAEYFLAEAAEESEGAGVFGPMGLHSSIGLAILVLAMLRLAWRAIDERPAWPATMKPATVAIARVAHGAFYVLLFALPLTGWMLMSTEGDAVSFFGLFTLPALPIADEETMEDVHEVLFNALIALGVLHAAAGVKHHFIDRDDVLRSMLPRA
jgi:cytochrome b561